MVETFKCKILLLCLFSDFYKIIFNLNFILFFTACEFIFCCQVVNNQDGTLAPVQTLNINYLLSLVRLVVNQVSISSTFYSCLRQSCVLGLKFLCAKILAKKKRWWNRHQASNWWLGELPIYSEVQLVWSIWLISSFGDNICI